MLVSMLGINMKYSIIVKRCFLIYCTSTQSTHFLTCSNIEDAF